MKKKQSGVRLFFTNRVKKIRGNLDEQFSEAIFAEENAVRQVLHKYYREFSLAEKNSNDAFGKLSRVKFFPATLYIKKKLCLR